ncbi:serrate RNA effector molecule homolog isoform X3 [Lytechinus variegatus]|nr:serrate RNA effector molecule homolog isoform X3 [Lytechinus variegatus]
MDSDEEFDRRRQRRDKFRGERRDYNDRRERDDRRRDDWQDRRGQVGRMSPTQMRNRNRNFRNEWSRRDFPDYDRGRQDRYSPPNRRQDMSPPAKRQRRDWDGGSYGYDSGHSSQGYSGYHGGWSGGGGGGGGGGSGGMRGGRGGQYQGQSGHGMEGDSGGRGESSSNQMLSFKQFLAKQEDSIDDQEAVKKYNAYKLEFHKAQLSEFFLAHKDEEWFRTKYYPDDCEREQADVEEGIDRRLRVFLEMLDRGEVNKVTLQADKSEGVTRLLDAVVIRLEGGNDFDLTILDQPESARSFDRDRTISESQRSNKGDDKHQDDKKEEGEEGEERDDDDKKDKMEGDGEIVDKSTDDEPVPPPPKDDDSKLSLPDPIPPPPQDDEKKEDDDEGKNGEVGRQGKKRKRGKKRKHREPDYSDSESDISSSSGSDSESDESGHEQGMLEPEPAPPGLESSGEKGASESDNKLEEGEAKEEGEEGEEGEKGEEEEEETKDPDEPKPRALHKTYSIFIRNVAPIIKKEEIVSLCKRYKGFMRVALADPQRDRNFQRHGWVTFDRTVNIKEICWNLSSIRLRDCELSPVVNRDLAHRIRAVSGIAAHKNIVKSDLKLAARLVQLMDQKHELFTGEPGWDLKKWKVKNEKRKKKEQEEKEKKKAEAAAAAAAAADGDKGEKTEKTEKTEEGSIEEKEETTPEEEPKEPLPARNPILENITDYLVEELSAEEEVLLGMKADGQEEGQEIGDISFEKDDHLCKVLDRLLLYLRVVHSLDYYNASMYKIEDEMPNRCGIMHCRGQNPPNRLSQRDVDNWQTNFENKIQPLMNLKSKMSDEELNKLGKKDQELEVEKFIKANTKELAKDKWLCPLSGKKFKGPEFVRKHIFNKHGDKIEAVKKEVLFFNNYLQDSSRHKVVEAAKPKPVQSSNNDSQGSDQGYNGQRSSSGYRGYQQQGSYDGGRDRGQQGYSQSSRGFNQSGRGGYDQSYGGGGYSSQGGNQRSFQRR